MPGGYTPGNFNSRPSARGDCKAQSATAWHPYFNSRPSARGDLPFTNFHEENLISIHAPPRGATRPRIVSVEADKFQFTPLREGRRKPLSYPFPRKRISIHAPPRGATRWKCRRLSATKFQFTPLREGRLNCPKRRASRSHFNSRPSARGDSTVSCPSACTKNFNSRPSARGDTTTEHTFCGPTYFNSRPSARGDQKHVRAVLDGEISIHAPPRGATCAAARFRRSGKFQFTPLREGRPGGEGDHRVYADFNSRPSARGDRCAGSHVRGRTHFNSRPSARGDQLLHRIEGQRHISIHAPPRGATETYIHTLTI